MCSEKTFISFTSNILRLYIQKKMLKEECTNLGMMIIHFLPGCLTNIIKIPVVSARRLMTVTKTAPGNETQLLSTYLLFINLFSLPEERWYEGKKKLQNVLIDINSINNVSLCQTFNNRV